MFLGHHFQESHIFEHSVTWRRAFVPVRMNKVSQAGIITETLDVVWERRKALWTRKASFFTQTPLIVTSEHVNIKISFSSAVRWPWYLNKRSNENCLNSNFHNEKGKSKSHIERPTLSWSQIWAKETKSTWGGPCRFIRARSTLNLHQQ